MPPKVAAGNLHAQMVAYLVLRGWRRAQQGSAWWWRDGFEEATTGAAVEVQLEADGIDLREMIGWEPQTFWRSDATRTV